ncbi:porin family protein [Sphingomicrobium clamense]|uniref:Porin family protein n=1 Tax=Sphingomicrobium clamense TaxID=2851013 RepID=A0ABS6V703_9SPHN|nr:porin family protein [Sphingomicrobium sp. B8]MBW0145271.1 porin family protein [Sphingomicrobium sp. B8]
MNKFALVSVALLAGTAFATPAAAQLASSGPRVEALAGWDFVRAQEDFGGNYKNDGAMFGVGAGYDLGLGAVALGVDVELSKSDIDDVVTYEEGGQFVQATLENGRELYVGGRVTIPAGVKTDVYVKAGYANLENELELAYDDGVDVFRERISDTEDGIRVGAGFTRSLAGNAYVGSEYRFTSFDSDLDKHQVVAKIGLRF